MKKVIILPLQGKTEEEGKVSTALAKEGYETIPVDISDLGKMPLKRLVKLIEMIDGVDAVYFMEGWHYDNVYRILYHCCKDFDIKILPNDSEILTIRIDIPVYPPDIKKRFPSLTRMKDLPCYNRQSERWCADVDIKTGQIKNWITGMYGTLFAKVTDQGNYWLLDGLGNIIKSISGYVPNKAIPPVDGYSDYVKLNIDFNGRITNWYKEPDFSKFDYSYDDDDDDDFEDDE
jgi:hypothetical protein